MGNNKFLELCVDKGLKLVRQSGNLFGVRGRVPRLHGDRQPDEQPVFHYVFRQPGRRGPGSDGAASGDQRNQIHQRRDDGWLSGHLFLPRCWPEREKDGGNWRRSAGGGHWGPSEPRLSGLLSGLRQCDGHGATCMAGGVPMHLCQDCYNAKSSMAGQNQQMENQKKENLVGGIVGALLGSLVGVIAIIILSQLGYVGLRFPASLWRYAR